MSLAYERASLPDYININELALHDRSCKANHNKTHIIVTTALNRCGTTFRETEEELIFSNALTSDSLPSSGKLINRNKEISLTFTCTYGRRKTVGSFNFLPAKQKLTVTESKWHKLNWLYRQQCPSMHVSPFLSSSHPYVALVFNVHFTVQKTNKFLSSVTAVFITHNDQVSAHQTVYNRILQGRYGKQRVARTRKFSFGNPKFKTKKFLIFAFPVLFSCFQLIY